ncbi:MAG: hypothetical protein EB084_07750 [Proteobacteria bacterium]|nr:hypothetical protein [Pseudomonadota bacterium]
MLLHDLTHDGQPQACPLPDVLRGEEGVEDSPDNARRDAGAVVVHLDDDLPAFDVGARRDGGRGHGV